MLLVHACPGNIGLSSKPLHWQACPPSPVCSENVLPLHWWCMPRWSENTANILTIHCSQMLHCLLWVPSHTTGQELPHSPLCSPCACFRVVSQQPGVELLFEDKSILVYQISKESNMQLHLAKHVGDHGWHTYSVSRPPCHGSNQGIHNSTSSGIAPSVGQPRPHEQIHRVAETNSSNYTLAQHARPPRLN